jgi:hypothetical protein
VPCVTDLANDRREGMVAWTDPDGYTLVKAAGLKVN